ncbi:Uncharacterised protein [Chryseobacterium nakagawai]|uniref:Uncharacterized protein n=1 Tax=Chryseobacterium nakagawai TaxID=1241982 RepID=A0AAD1DT14_CHRNA|nr:hypothetical protein [Chryseobacterium nakagawai]AZA93080.1 hypothetical protein EG343_21975 [Chryseobacterium nakagawai]VEH19719.1 Uncharacterised protein [Chryseobacterium nakagawai]
MKIFNFFKKKDIQPFQKELEKLIPKEEEKTHEFIERCQFLKEEIGFEVPLSVIETFKRHDLPKHNYYYSIFWHVDDDSFNIFYTEAFIELVVSRYKEIHGQDVDLTELSMLLDEAIYEYRIKEKCFDRTNLAFDFINKCYEEFRRSGEELILTMDLGHYDHLILNKEEKGNIADSISSYTTTAGIKYKILTEFRPLPEVIRETLDRQKNNY